MSKPYAFVTLVSSDSYLPGALALVAALKDVHPQPVAAPEVLFQTICLVTPETVDVKTIRLLRQTFDLVIGVEIIEEDTADGLKLLGRPDLNTVLTKLHVFRLTQFEKLIYLDADILPIRPISHLFTLPYEFSAVPDVGWPDIFNSGVMVLSPGEDKFQEIMDLVKSKGSWDGGDQGVLNEWRGSDWHRLSFTYNTTPTAAYTYAPAYERFGSHISAIHFIGPNKPWSSLLYRAPSSASQIPSSTPASTTSTDENTTQQSYSYSSLVDRWYDTYDRNYRRIQPQTETPFEVKRYDNVWDDTPTQSVETEVQSEAIITTLGLDDLRKAAVEGVHTRGFSIASTGGEGEYRSMPLEGRVDLMRPKKEPILEDQPVDTATHPAFDLRTVFHPEGQNEHRISPPLRTPGPDEVPPSPHLQPRSLPPSSPSSPDAHWNLPPHPPANYPSHNPESDTHDYEHPPHHSHLPHHSYSESHHPPTHHGHAGHQHPHSDHHGHPGHQHSHHDPHIHQHQHHHNEQRHLPRSEPHYEPPRPPSPPMITWNPAKEPPPNVAPPLSAFPTDSYFPNVWDVPAGSGKLHAALTGEAVPKPTALFDAPPADGRIPQRLVQEGHYTNVTGPSVHTERGDQPAPPDRSKVVPVFPWEEKPRHTPGRYFPPSDAPPPGAPYIESQVTPTAELTPKPKIETALQGTVLQLEVRHPQEPEEDDEEKPPAFVRRVFPKMQIHIPSTAAFRSGAYTNAWDAVPSIQKYASRLAKPPPAPSPPGSTSSPRGRRSRSDSYRSWEERVEEANSMDGDDEDEGEDEGTGQWGDESSRERGERRRPKGSKSGSKTPPSATVRMKIDKKEYRSHGVQTIPKEVRNQAVQVSSLGIGTTTKNESHITPKTGKARVRRGSKVSPPLEAPGTPTIQEQRPMTTRATAHVQTTGVMSPRLHEPHAYGSPVGQPMEASPPLAVPLNPSAITSTSTATTKSSKIFSPPPQVVRLSSIDSVESPPTSIGPESPADPPNTAAQPARKGRAWDPATSVDQFKRSSEEVLARFLRMSSWDD